MNRNADSTDAYPGASIHRERITWDGCERSYRLTVPANGGRAGAFPAVIALHGGGGSGERMARGIHLDALAARDGFLAVYPDGVADSRGAQNWNDGRADPRFHPYAQQIDDAGFIAHLLDRLADRFPIDARRIYATGISNGGMMAYRLACDLADRFAAIAPLGCSMTSPSCNPSRPVSVLHIHGTADRYIPMEGGSGILRTRDYQLRPVREVIEFWRRHDGCSASVEVSEIGTAAEPVRRERYPGGHEGTEVTLITVEGGGHTWPGAVPSERPRAGQPLGAVSTAISATQLIWDFFAAHPRPA